MNRSSQVRAHLTQDFDATLTDQVAAHVAKLASARHHETYDSIVAGSTSVERSPWIVNRRRRCGTDFCGFYSGPPNVAASHRGHRGFQRCFNGFYSPRRGLHGRRLPHGTALGDPGHARHRVRGRHDRSSPEPGPVHVPRIGTRTGRPPRGMQPFPVGAQSPRGGLGLSLRTDAVISRGRAERRTLSSDVLRGVQ